MNEATTTFGTYPVFSYYDFIVVANTLYRINRSTGEAWQANHGVWDRITERTTSEAE